MSCTWPKRAEYVDVICEGKKSENVFFFFLILKCYEFGSQSETFLKKTVLTQHFHFTSYYYYPTKTSLVQLTKISRESPTVNKMPSHSPFSIWFNIKMINLFKQFNGKQFSFANDVKTQISVVDSRPQNNGQSTDNVQPRWPFMRTNIRFAGHFDRTHKQASREKNIFTAVRFKRSSIPFHQVRIFMLLSCFFDVMTCQMERRDRDKISRAGQHDCQQSQQFYFEL